MTRQERREALDDLKTEIEEIDEDVRCKLIELADLKSEIIELRARRVAAVAKRAELKAVTV